MPWTVCPTSRNSGSISEGSKIGDPNPATGVVEAIDPTIEAAEDEDGGIKQDEGTYHAIRFFCRECAEEPEKGVRNCPFTDCPVYSHRFGVRPATARKRGLPVGDTDINARKAVGNFCRDFCMVGQTSEVTKCTSLDCRFWPLRFSKSLKAATKAGKMVDREEALKTGWVEQQNAT